jgi:4-hydroxy-tetrahydrodipicolinate reductase
VSGAARILVFGACGRMGERVRTAVAEEPRARLGAAVESPGHPRLGEALEDGVVLDEDVRSALAACDAAIVFAPPQPSLDLVKAAAKRKLPCAVGTTGFSARQREELDSLANRVPLCVAANFSVTVNVLFYLTREASARLGPDFAAELVELHHGTKVDAPSGTALRLAEAVAEGRGQTLAEHQVLVREGLTGPRVPGTIGIQTLRGGDNPGEHTVLFIGQGERLELIHRSATRDHFARGALRAALWLRGKAPGLYDMEQVLGLS